MQSLSLPEKVKSYAAVLIAVAAIIVFAFTLSITEADSAQGAKAPQSGDLSNSVFYIAVKETPSSAIKYYHYTIEELQAYETTGTYKYVEHNVSKTVTTKGVLLKTLLNDLDGVKLTGEMVVQYAEEDGYHADAGAIIDNSWYKDKVKWLDKPYYKGNLIFEPTRAMVTYSINETFAKQDSSNTNDPEGVFKDADNGTGYLRVYREAGSKADERYAAIANTSVMKHIMGVVISPDGKLLSGQDGYTVQIFSDKNDKQKISSDIEVKGLLPGMQYAARMPMVSNAKIAEGKRAAKLITVKSGTKEIITFTSPEKTYFYLQDGNNKTEFAYTDLAKQMKQIPEAKGNTQNYGYEKPMYYRYNGVWLADLVGKLNEPDKIEKLEIVAQNGTKIAIAKEDLGKLFVAIKHTNSINSLDAMEEERTTTDYNFARVLIPGTGVSVYGGAEADYTAEGKNVDVLVGEAAGLLITRK